MNETIVKYIEGLIAGSNSRYNGLNCGAFYLKLHYDYLARIAVTGSNLAADTAGIKPAIIPTKAEVPNPVNILGMLKTTSKSIF